MLKLQWLKRDFAAMAICTLTLLPAAAAPSQTEPSSTSAKAQLFLWKSTEPLSVAAVLGQFELFDRDLNALSAHFTQSMNMDQTGMASSIEGTVSYLKPDHLRIRHVRPEAQTIISDGRELWIYRPSQNQAIQSSLEGWKQADPMLNSLMQFGSYSTMLKNYDVSLDTTSVAPILILRPKPQDKKKEDFTLRLTLASTSLFPGSTELLIGDMRIRTQFDSIEFNPKIDRASFNFTPPAGTDVFRDFKPPKFKP